LNKASFNFDARCSLPNPPQIFANCLLILNSFASCFDMDIDIVFPKISFNFQLVLPGWLKWYPNVLSQIFDGIVRALSRISLQNLAAGLQVSTNHGH
jgi:hypothetical protein